MSITTVKIDDFDNNYIYFKVPVNSIDFNNFMKQNCNQVAIEFKDGRTISPEQRRMIWALIGAVAEWQCGYKTSLILDDVAFDLKREFLFKIKGLTFIDNFSLSDCSVALASEFIKFLISFILANDISSKVLLRELCEDINHYVYACLMNKKCACCGKPAEMHHVDAIGQGRDRRIVYQIGMRVISLCRTCHTKAHAKGVSWLYKDMHLVAISLTEEIGKIYRLTNKNLYKEGAM